MDREGRLDMKTGSRWFGHPKRIVATRGKAVALALAFACSPVLALDCQNDDVIGAIDCVGLEYGNLNNTAKFASFASTVEAGLGVSGLSYSGTNSASFGAPDTSGYSTLTFNEQLSGKTVVGIHWGNYTGFYLLDLATPTNTLLVENKNDVLALTDAPGTGGGLSNGHVYITTPVPEPGTLALMVAGLAAVGFVARRRRPR
jgi:hypothetical protein